MGRLTPFVPTYLARLEEVIQLVARVYSAFTTHNCHGRLSWFTSQAASNLVAIKVSFLHGLTTAVLYKGSGSAPFDLERTHSCQRNRCWRPTRKEDLLQVFVTLLHVRMGEQPRTTLTHVI